MASAALDLHLNDGQLELYERTRRLAVRQLKPLADAGEPGTVNRPLVRALAQHGLLEALFTGDGEVSSVVLCLIREALARGCTEAETAFALQGLGAYPIVQAGSAELRERWLPLVASGEAIAAFALTEPEAGSDAAAISLKAEPTDDGDGGYRLSGEKLWISNAPEADLYTVFARGDRGAADRVRDPRRRARAERRAGASAGPARDRLADLRRRPGRRRPGARRARWRLCGRDADARPVPPERRRVRDRDGAGGARPRDLVRAGARDVRQAIWRSIQAVAHRLAELQAQTQAARLMVHQAARAHDEQRRDPALAAMAKLLATEIAQQAIDAAVQFHGAVALEQGHPLEHLYREVRATRIYEGASEIQREIISRSMFREARERQ